MKLTDDLLAHLGCAWGSASRDGRIRQGTVYHESAAKLAASMMVSVTQNEWQDLNLHQVFVALQVRFPGVWLQYAENLIYRLRGTPFHWAEVLAFCQDMKLEHLVPAYRQFQDPLAGIAEASEASRIARSERMAAKSARSPRGAGPRSKIRPGGVR